MSRSPLSRVTAPALAAVMAAVMACVPSPTADPGSTSGVDYRALRGDINIDGSSTVFPITEAAAEEFGVLTRGKVRITVGISGTGGGFTKFCSGETMVQDASRPIKQSEVDACRANGIEFIELPIAIDGLSVLANPANTWLSCITTAELKRVWEPGAERKITRWNQVRPEWPDLPLRLYGPATDSGTFDYFTETINGKAQASRGDFTASEDDNVLVQGIAGDRNALGFFGYAYYAENQGKLKAVAVDGGKGCVAPTPETINNGTYAPLSRPIFIYVRKDAAGQAHAREFVRYYLSVEGQKLVDEVGYIPFPPAVYDLALARFEEGKTGTVFGGATPRKGTVQEVLQGDR